MRWLVWAVAGAALGALLVLVVGVLSIQVIAQESGAVVDLENTIVAIDEPRLPVLPLAGIAVLSAAALGALWAAPRGDDGRGRTALPAAFALATATLVVVGGASAASPTPLPDGLTPGWRGWLEHGAMSPAVHVMLLLSLALLVRSLRTPRARPRGHASAATP